MSAPRSTLPLNPDDLRVGDVTHVYDTPLEDWGTIKDLLLERTGLDDPLGALRLVLLKIDHGPTVPAPLPGVPRKVTTPSPEKKTTHLRSPHPLQEIHTLRELRAHERLARERRARHSFLVAWGALALALLVGVAQVALMVHGFMETLP